MMSEALIIRQARERAIDFINSHFKDIESLAKANELQSTTTEKLKKLEVELLSVTSKAPGKLNRSVNDAEEAGQSVAAIKSRCDEVVKDVAAHTSTAAPLCEFLSELTNQIKELEQVAQYLLCISQFEDLSSDIQSALLINESQRAVERFLVMAHVADYVKNSRYANLVQFSKKTIVFWNKILKDKLSGEFDECLKAWQWPFIVTSIKSIPVNNPAEIKQKLTSLFIMLARLHEAEELIEEKKIKIESLSYLPPIRSILLPVQYLLKPFQKRFEYHFCGSQKTNNREKPEWFYTQILSWIRDHREFLVTRVQSAVDESSVSSCDVLTEFSRGLVLLVIHKLVTDLSDWLEDEALFAHFVDETLSFHRELRDVYVYPDSLPSSLHVLIQSKPFNLWIDLEKKFAQEKMDQILSSASAWKPQYKDIVDVDDLKISECGEAFVTLLHTITDRYKLLPSAAHRYQFIQLQLDLLDDFRIRLVQLRKQLLSDSELSPLQPQYCSILNTVSYITDILQRWADQPFFIRLQCYKQKIETGGEKRSVRLDDVTTDESSVENSADNNSAQLSRISSFVESIDGEGESAWSPEGGEGEGEVEGSVFDEMISLLDRMRSDMLHDVTLFILDDVKARSRPYRKDKWLTVSSHKDFSSLTLSSSACSMLKVLKSHLHDVDQMLCESVMSQCWRKITSELNKFIYSEVILRNRFSEGGAAQLQFDMTRNLFSLFSTYTSKPENYFKDVKEACLVLTLSPGSLMLLKEVLYKALHEPHSSQVSDPVAALLDIGVFKLSLEQVELLISLRVDINS